MKPVFVESAGVLAPGLAGWAASREVLAGERPYVAEPIPATIATLLPANERRRTTATVKLALQVAQEALELAEAGLSPLEVLSAASWGARAWLGRPGLEEGDPADLVVYDADPRADLRALGSPGTIVLRGRTV